MDYKKLTEKRNKVIIKTIFIVMLLTSQAYGDDKLVVNLMEVARQNITQAKFQDGSFIPSETEAEKLYPIIPIEDARRIVAVGQKSGIAAWCGIEWQKSIFSKLMENERSKKTWTQKQLAYIGLLHGITMGSFEKAAQDGNGKCSKEQANKILNSLKE
jgi:hypothetical protein